MGAACLRLGLTFVGSDPDKIVLAAARMRLKRYYKYLLNNGIIELGKHTIPGPPTEEEKYEQRMIPALPNASAADRFKDVPRYSKGELEESRNLPYPPNNLLPSPLNPRKSLRSVVIAKHMAERDGLRMTKTPLCKGLGVFPKNGRTIRAGTILGFLQGTYADNHPDPTFWSQGSLRIVNNLERSHNTGDLCISPAVWRLHQLCEGSRPPAQETQKGGHGVHTKCRP